MDSLRRQLCFFLMVMMAVTWSCPTLAYENEPVQFRGIFWGQALTGTPDMDLVLDGGALKAYVRKGEDLTLGEAGLDRIHYVFYKEHFYCVYIEFSGPSNFAHIKETLFDWYGPGEEKQASGSNFYWTGATANVTLNYNEAIQKGELGFKYVPIDTQIALEEATNQTR